MTTYSFGRILVGLTVFLATACGGSSSTEGTNPVGGAAGIGGQVVTGSSTAAGGTNSASGGTDAGGTKSNGGSTASGGQGLGGSTSTTPVLGTTFSCGNDSCVVGQSYCYGVDGGPPPAAANAGINPSCVQLPVSCMQTIDCACLCSSVGINCASLNYRCTSVNGQISLVLSAP